MKRTEKLIVLDIDNTVFNWVEYYVSCMNALFYKLHEITKIPVPTLYQEAQKVFEAEGTIEYPFVIQELPSVVAHYNPEIERMLREAVEPGRLAFNRQAESTLIPYSEVKKTLTKIKQLYPHVPIVALTDAPRYVAMWKLNKLDLLEHFAAVYGLADPRIPADPDSHKVKVDSEILIKHLQKSQFGFQGRIRILPDDYEKPGMKGLKTVLMDYDMESHKRDVLWIGDNLRKDVGLGTSLGVRTGWARYGTIINQESRDTLLLFSPIQNVAKNMSIDPAGLDSPQPDFVLDCFSDLLRAIEDSLMMG